MLALATFILFPIRKRHFETPLAFVYILLALATCPLQASQEFQSRESISEVARKFALTLADKAPYSKTEVEVGQIDARLRLPACDKTLLAFLPPGGRTLGNTTVGIRCSGLHPWTLYVPVKVAVFRQVVVTTRALTRGAIITAADLKMAPRNLAKLQPDFLTDPSQVLGNHLKRQLFADTPLTSSMLTQPRLIRRGDRVTLLTETKGLQIRVIAEALMDGRSGERIRVRNISSKRIVEGVVMSPGVVRVNN